MNFINKNNNSENPISINDICASFQQAVIDVQVAKAKSAIEQIKAKTFCFGGGVAANPQLREAYTNMCNQLGVELVMPPLSACGDNAVMIALAANDRFKDNCFFELDADVTAQSVLDNPY